MSKLLTKEDIKNILSQRFEDDRFSTLSSLPTPDMFKDMQKAAKRVAKAVYNNEKITIVGDYDVDGVVSSFILSDFLERVSDKVDVVIPDRFKDGYGISKDIIEDIDASLIITVDNGISSLEAAEVCKSKGIDLIITDHHTPAEMLPDAFAIINPKQKDCPFPYKEICGAQVAWYFAGAIKQELGLKINMLEYVDLLGIAIVADMMELKDLNRLLVKKSLVAINSSKRASILAIKSKFAKTVFRSEDISFLFSPLLNSAGRMESAVKAFKFLKAKSLDEALRLLDEIVLLNEKRKAIEKELFEISLKSVDESKDIVVVWGEGWHEGVIGIVAAKLARRFEKPAIVFSINEDIAKGSARSVGEVDILEIISREKENILHYGGHKGAAGLSLNVKDLPSFKKSVENSVSLLKKELFVSSKDVLGEIDPKEIDFELLDILEFFEPYGYKNPKPCFFIKNATVKKERILGKEKNHQKIIVESKNQILESINFNYKTKVDIGSNIDMIFTISKNDYRGYITPQLMVEKIV
ncbi:MAG: single-stranded-DNA-specific exonuclease RecJ [Epsilonproteobacteria bacterium]|nr:single-stranded-DNA-specific exonuclease RecJ [Campylobacterota bacterium]